MKILMIGCGGIGVELLNNLAHLKPLKELHMVDMDTIELSNLSRQYIFKQEDIGKYKSEVSSCYFSKLRNDVTTKYFVSAIENQKQFPISYFCQFDYIINALDNIQARQYVSKQVYLNQLIQIQNNEAITVLIDSGTAGLSGSVTVYDDPSKQQICCRRSADDQPIPVCTLRSKPTVIKHCIIYAKYFVERVLGGQDNELSEFEHIADKITVQQVIEIFKTQLPQLLQDNDNNKINQILESYKIENISQNKVLERDECIFIIFYSLTQFPFTKPFIYSKDDNNQQLLVNAVATLRAKQFDIAEVSTFQSAQIANRIVPAVGFCNALVAAITGNIIQNKNNNSQMILINQRYPYVYNDQNEKKQEFCEYCCQQFATSDTQYIKQYIQANKEYLLYDSENTQVLGEKEEENSWFDENDDNDDNELEDDKLYVLRNKELEENSYIYVKNNQKYQILQQKQIFQKEDSELLGSSDF